MNRLLSNRRFTHPLRIMLIVCCSLTVLSSLHAENWPRFRGADGSGISEEKGFPLQWTEKDYAWHMELP